jgi:hypothetical protein
MEESKKEEKVEVKEAVSEEAKKEEVKEEAKPVESTASAPKPKTSSMVVGLWVVIVVLAASTGFLGWQYFKKSDTNKKQVAQIGALQNQLKDIQDQLGSFEDWFGDIDISATPTPTTTPTISASLVENIAAAIDTMNTAALEGYMADSVYVVYAASEYAGDKTPTEAVADLDYLASAIGSWDFDLPQATLDAYEAGFYSDYFGDDCVVGQSSDDYVVSFRINNDGHIDQVFITSDAALLL